jgi:predicted Zn-dependent protease
MLAAAAGYNPMGMSTFLDNLGQVERLMLRQTRLPTFFDTHPGSQERAGANAARAQEIRWKRDPALGDTHRSYLRRIDGLALGERPEVGVFEGDRFLHPDLDFQIRFPHGWRTSNTNRAVGAVSPRGEAAILLSADLPEGDLAAVAGEFAEEMKAQYGVGPKRSQPVKIGRLDAWRMQLEGSGVAVHVTLIPYRGSTWRVTGFSRSIDAKKYRPHMLNTARSFRPLTAEERSSIETTRLSIVTAHAGEDLAELCRRTGNAWDASRTAVLNGIFANHRFDGGELVKIARVEPYVPGKP